MPPARLSRASRLEPWALAAIVAATRIPFFARTLFEFDSVNFAVALFRYDLSQDTPHLPGYVLHVGIAKLLYLLVGDANLSYVLESFFLSIGSVLFVWWGVRSVTDGRVAFYSALVWSLNPIFWFQSCVAAAYGHEAFFTAAFAAYAVRYAANAEQERARLFYPVTLAIIIGVAGAARQTSVMFLAPAFVVALRAMRAPRRVWLIASGVALGLTAIWVAVLLSLAGGLDRYLELTHYVHVVQYNSIFLHGTLTRHLDMIGKMLLFLVIGTAPFS